MVFQGKGGYPDNIFTALQLTKNGNYKSLTHVTLVNYDANLICTNVKTSFRCTFALLFENFLSLKKYLKPVEWVFDGPNSTLNSFLIIEARETGRC